MTVENISIAVKSTGADTAARHINSLVGALSALEKVTAQMTGINNLGTLSNAVSTLANNRVSVSIFNSMSKGIENLSAALKTITAEEIGKLQTIANTLGNLNNVNLAGLGNASSIARAASSLGHTATNIKAVGNAASKATSPLGTFLSSLKRIAMYRLLRTIIKEIMQAIKEGIDNLYSFSKKNNDFGGIASSFDGLASAAQKMKNQLGATFGQMLSAASPFLIALMNLVTKLTELLYPLVHVISALEPVITAILNVVTDLVNVIISLFDLLGINVGKIVAQDAAKEWGEANSAAKKYKNTILGFDEINRLNGQNGSGGTFEFTDNIKLSYDKDNNPFDFIIGKIDDTKTALGGLAAVPVPEIELELDVDDKATEKLDGIVQRVNDAFPIYATVVMAVEGNPIPFIQTVRVAIAKFVKNSVAYFKEWQTAYAKACSTVSEESYSLAGNLKTAFAKDEEAAQSWLEHFWQKVGEYQRACGALELENTTLENDTEDVFNRLNNPLNDWVSHAWQKVGEYQRASGALQVENATLEQDLAVTLDGMKRDIDTFMTQTLPAWGAWAKGVAQDAWSGFSSAAQSVYNALNNAGTNIVTFANEAGSAIYKWASGALNTVSTWASSLASKISTGLKNAWEKVKRFAESLGETLSNSYSTSYEIDGIQTVTVQPVIPSISLFPFFSGGLAPIPVFADGGMPDMGSLFFAGEAGAEIVANMGNRTGVMNIEQMREAIKEGMLEALSVTSDNRDGKTEVHVYLDSREIKYGQSRLARAMGV